MESPDIQAKYQKLAAEYSKLRAQNQVLKKGVVDEQGKTQQLSELLKNRDQQLRKAEQENDSLTFRNQQLTKRLMLLQEDLDEIQIKNKKGRGKSDSVTDNTPSEQDVFTEELQLKIQENARLQSELADIEAHYRKKVSDLESQLETALREVQKNKDMLQHREKSANEIVDQLESERVRQEVVAQQKESELRSLKEQITILQEKIKNPIVASNSRVLDIVTRKEDEKAAHSHEKNISASNLNIPVQNGRDKITTVSARSLVESFDAVIQEFCMSFAKFLCTYSTRVKLYEHMSEVKQKLMEALNSAAAPWHSLAAAYHQLAENAAGEGIIALETLSGLSQVSHHVTSCGASLRKVLPLVVHWVSESSRGQADGDRLGATWSASFSRLVAAWGSLAPYVATLANQCSSNSSLPPSAQGRVISMLSDRLNNLCAALKEAGNSYQRKSASQKDLPSTSGEAKAANDEIVQVLNSLSTVTNKMSTIFKEQVVPSWSRSGSTPSTPSSPYVGMPYTLNKSRNLESNLQEDGHSSLEDVTLVSPSESANLGDSEASLMKQLALASSKLSQLEAEREHWRLEHQLLQCKHQKEAKRVRQLENQIKGDSTATDGEMDGMHSKDRTSSQILSTSLLGEVHGSDGASEEREKDIRNHFTSRCSHLYMQLTSASSQAALYQNECESLMRRLVVSEENKASSELEVDKQRESVNHLKETLQTTSRNYEEQISTMSEHLADLNEKLTRQTEYIEQLKYEIKNKKGKK